MKVGYINPFLASTLNLFQTTFSVEPTAGKPYVLKDLLKHRWEISGVMVLTGSAIGVVAIRLTRLLSNKLLERSGLKYSTQDERENLVKDLVGELVNIIAGNASNRLEDYDIKISVPFVVQGENHTVSWPDRSPIVCIPFTTPFGPFEVNISMIERVT